MSATADVVVVGGGAVGVSAAYHLAAAGAGRVLLLERADSLGMGSTGACAGGFRFQFSSRINIQLSLASVPMITGFSDVHGLPLDVWRDGYLFLVRDPVEWEAFGRAAELQRSLGVDVRMLSPEEATEVAPGISLENVVGATYCPDEGIADPSGLTNGYATLARGAGAEIRTGVEVEQISSVRGLVTGVVTNRERIQSPVVVNAAGPWAGPLAATCGVDVPIEPIPRNVVVTGSFPDAPERRTLVIDAETSFYFHREGDGVLMGMGGRDEHASFDTSVDRRFVEERLLPTAMRVFPPVAEAEVRAMWNGLYEMTPDRHPIIGPVQGLGGLYLANGFSGHGFQHAPIVGKLLAEMIVGGRAKTIDVSSLSLERFARGDLVPESRVV
ncbi:MAG TPA: FAD-dependent oxidoreductase [Actinomycetota bacterium]